MYTDIHNNFSSAVPVNKTADIHVRRLTVTVYYVKKWHNLHTDDQQEQNIVTAKTTNSCKNRQIMQFQT